MAFKREDGGKVRVTSLLWEALKVILKGEVLEVRNVDGALHIARKIKRIMTTGTHRSRPYNPYGRAISSLMTDNRCAQRIND